MFAPSPLPSRRAIPKARKAARLIPAITSRPVLCAIAVIGADLLALVLTFLLAPQLSLHDHRQSILETAQAIVCILPVLLGAYVLFGLYPGLALDPITEMRNLSKATSIVFLSLGSIGFMSKYSGSHSAPMFLLAWGLALVSVPALRFMTRRLCCSRLWWGYSAAIISTNLMHQTTVAILELLAEKPELGLRPVAVLHDSDIGVDAIAGVPCFAETAEACRALGKAGVTHGILVVPSMLRREALDRLRREVCFPHLLIVSDVSGLASFGIYDTRNISHLIAFGVRNNLLRRFPQAAKRMMDVLLTLLIAIVALPVLALIAMLIRLDSPGPVFYGQRRIGKHSRQFRLWKFRSMVQNSEQVLVGHLARTPQAAADWLENQKLKNDPRITRIGKFLRATSLDELPQLWNVLTGEMSLVGPRPIVQEEISRYGTLFDLYTQVTPGMTGLWQVSGRNDTSYSERIELDAYYIRNWTPLLDFYLLAKTAGVVLKRQGAY